MLEDGSSHSTSLKNPDSHQGGTFDRQIISLDAASVFRRSTLLKGDNEMSIAELRAKDAEAAKAGAPSYGQYFIQLKYSIPAACLVLALVGLTLGVTNRKDGKFASFVLGFVVVFIYQQIMWTCRGLALTGRLSPGLAAWIPNIVVGAAGVVLLLWRAGSSDRPIRFVLPSFLFRWGRRRPDGTGTPQPPAPARRRVVTIVVRIPRLDLPRPRLLDLYIMRQFLRVFGTGQHRAAGNLLHRHADRVRHLPVSRHRHHADGAPAFLFRDAALRDLPDSAVGAHLHAGRLRPAHQEQRADRHAGMRREPVSIGGPDRAPRRRR